MYKTCMRLILECDITKTNTINFYNRLYKKMNACYYNNLKITSDENQKKV